MVRNSRLHFGLFLVVVALATIGMLRTLGREDVRDAVAVGRPPQIDPDYTDTVIPPNIAPLNFVVREPGSRFLVKIESENTAPIEIVSRSPSIEIAPKRWRALLDANRGQEIDFNVYTKVDGDWRRFQTITNRVAQYPIDGHLVYRLTGSIYQMWNEVGVYQRDLETCQTSPVLEGTSFANGCVNCHSFNNNRPNQMCISMRSEQYGNGAIIVVEGKAKKLATKFAYTSWHPSGKLAVFSINNVRQFLHSAQSDVRDVIDMDAALGYLKVEAEKIELVPAASDKQRLETYPCWSPDGQYLYYCSAPILWEGGAAIPPERYKEVQYDLMRISYDIDTDSWGEPELVLSAAETGLSILEPRISPDGKFLVFCMCEYGCFPIYQPTSDLFVMDLDTGEYSKPDINSPESESWHSWSSNSRWIAFSSRRRGGIFTRCYFSFIDESGRAHKPFIMPQKDPTYYGSLLKSISVPELVSAPVSVDPDDLGSVARGKGEVVVDAITAATTFVEMSEPWTQGQH